MTTCPACDNFVDPLRSRFVGVRDGKVVAYCSAECAAGRPRAQAGRAMSPATGVPARIPTPPVGVPGMGGPPDGLAGGSIDSGPVIEILHEPASGVVTSARDARVERRARHPDEIPIAAFWAADRADRAQKAERAEKERSGAVRASAVPREDAHAGHHAAVTAGRDAAERGGRDSAEASEGQRAEADAAGTRRGPVERAGDGSAQTPEGQHGAGDAAGARRDPSWRSGEDSAEASEAHRGSAVDAAGAARRDPAGRTGGDSAEASEGQRGAAVDAAGAARRDPAGRTGGDFAEAFEGQRAAVEGAGARRGPDERGARGTAKASARGPAPELREVDGAGRAARRDPGGRSDAAALNTSDSPRRRMRWPLVVLILVLLGAGAGLLYHFFGGLSVRGAGRDGHAAGDVRGAPAPAGVAPAARAELSRPVRPPPAAAAPVVDLAGAVELARAALRRDLAATSSRVQRLAAAALARTQDREACELLAAQIGFGTAGAPVAHAGAAADELAGNDIARLDLAYALARGGDRRGAEVLARALGAPRGEARDEAAGLLALLGDKRAVPHLLDLLAVEQRRLGAAEHLARLAEPRALQVLDHVRGDPRASADDKARATVALGTAGRSAVAGALRDMLGDPHFNAFAAAALAAQGDRAARPVLERQLTSPPLRVLAARALRRLDPAIDPRPLLPPLLDVVRAGRDIDRIPAAEAVLLLAGPANWSAYD